MGHLKALPFLIPAALFAGLLCYAVFNALAIYIPQQREIKNFEELKESVQAPARVEQADETGEEPEAAALPNPYEALRERNADFVGWLNIPDSGIDYPVMKSPEDDPEWSNFTRFFAQNFETFGLRKLISTSYAANSKKTRFQQLSPLERNSPQFDEKKRSPSTAVSPPTTGGRISPTFPPATPSPNFWSPRLLT